MTRDEPSPMPPAAVIAAQFLSWLESSGATACLTEGDEFCFDLNGIADMTFEDADAIAHAIFALRTEIRALLLARRRTVILH